MRRAAVLIALWGALTVVPAEAALKPQPGPGDPHLHLVEYDPDQVVLVQGVLGYQIMIEFDRDERIENVAIGDALGWQVTPNRRANLIFLKPMQRGPHTNMTVVTNQRRYVFDLGVSAAAMPRDGLYTLRFLYPLPAAPVVEIAAPAPPPEPPAPPKDVNHAYTYKGSESVLPERVFDDGQMTYFKFRPGTDYPAIFIIDAAGQEAIVNSFVKQDFVVVDRIARGFVLRQGKSVATLVNEGLIAPAPSAVGPQQGRPGKAKDKP